MTFHHPELLWLLLALPLVALLRGRRGPKAGIEYPSIELARGAMRQTRSRPGLLASGLRLLSAGLFVLALARPQIVDAKTRTEASGVDMVLAVDVSTSMEARDMELAGEPADRLTAVKSVIEKFITARPNDRIGMIAFAGAPYLVSPPTLDHDWLSNRARTLQTGMVKDGTAIGSALTASVNRLRSEGGKSKVIVLLTDGVNNAGKVSPALAAQAAAAEGVKVYTIAVGSEGKAMMPVSDDRGGRKMVLAQVDVDEASLREIANTTGARFFRATDVPSLERVYAEIDAMEKTTRTTERSVSYRERFQWPSLAGLGVLGLELLAGLSLRRRIP